eukprot:CAMPEP_0182457764 /NCGR_PEP_ID=MMETSP1319-20130603/3256_1 /TAXON_ID=172717 /ORGANISM="Bolidomonas pacifica, Strain RCC208" /LENGTH=351 /DNA_ID=CAMNT_0024656299 /DNA_START=33 /DNA_END=1088 /DNA_ORIENTATION=-
MSFNVVASADDRVFLKFNNMGIRNGAASTTPLPTTPTVGYCVMAPFKGKRSYPGKVSAVSPEKGPYKVDVRFDDGDFEKNIEWSKCRGQAAPKDIHEAVKKNDLEAVKRFIEAGQNLNATGPDGNYPLGLASCDGLIDIVNELIKGGAEVNKTAGNGAAALHYASFKGQEACVRRLLEAGADVTIAANNGMTPLEWAVAHKRPQIVQILKSLTPDPNAALKEKNATADPKAIDLFEAVRIGDVVGIERAASEADVNITNDDNETPLHKAVLYDHLANQASVVNALIKGGANVDALRNGGWSPLHLAAEHGQDECAKILLAAGANKTLEGSNGMTALDIANVCGSTTIAKML